MTFQAFLLSDGDTPDNRLEFRAKFTSRGGYPGGVETEFPETLSFFENTDPAVVVIPIPPSAFESLAVGWRS